MVIDKFKGKEMKVKGKKGMEVWKNGVRKLI
jgi:hypothetical protein